ncbi:hypothetical protein [Pseudoalteromonas sp. XMcav11-Q]|uniref:hypothetical protein n=1 Tax=Pseudoalteromonas sp. XMcav11-Q TaxID=3136665 RepID=UPI0032C43D2B
MKKKKPKTLVVATSSFHPIDLTAAIFNLLQDNSAQLKILVESGSGMTSLIPRARCGAAYHSLPLPLAITENGGVVRQLHIPLDLEKKGIGFSLYINALKKLPGSSVINFNKLEIFSDINGKPESSMAEALSLVLKELLSGQNIIVDEIKSYAQRKEGVYETLQALEALENQLINSDGEVFDFLKGGYLELKTFKETKKFRGAKVIFDAVYLIDEKGFEKSTSYIKSLIERGRAILFFKGPMELHWLESVGSLAHLPWYCELIPCSKMSKHGISVDEYISPFSVASKIRSPAFGSNKYRLEPSGYTLLDYLEVDQVRKFVSLTISRDGIAEGLEKTLWKKVTDLYPAVKQKALKSQSSSSYIRQELLKNSLRELKSGNELGLQVFMQEGDVFISDKLTQLASLVKLLREKKQRPNGNFEFSNLQFETLSKAKLLEGNVVSNIRLMELCKSVLSEALIWCSWMAPSSKAFEPKSLSSDDLNHAVNQIVGYRSQFEYDNNNHIDCCNKEKLESQVKIIENVLERVIEIMIAYLAGPLKAHIFNLWLLDESNLRKSWQCLSSKRRFNSLSLKVVLWRVK